MSIVYDAGVLVAADRSERQIWADHRARLELGMVPVTTAPVVAQASRSPDQAQLRRFLRGCDVVPFAADAAHEVGFLLGQAASSDVVDAHVVVVASQMQSVVLTSDASDLRTLSEALRSQVPVRPI